jgi:hypothetical protein
MALMRSVKELVQNPIANDPTFGKALPLQGVDTMLSADADTGKAILRNYVKGDDAVRESWRGGGQPAEKPYAQVRPAWQRVVPQLPRHYRASCRSRRGIELRVR